MLPCPAEGGQAAGPGGGGQLERHFRGRHSCRHAGGAVRAAVMDGGVGACLAGRAAAWCARRAAAMSHYRTVFPAAAAPWTHSCSYAGSLGDTARLSMDNVRLTHIDPVVAGQSMSFGGWWVPLVGLSQRVGCTCWCGSACGLSTCWREPACGLSMACSSWQSTDRGLLGDAQSGHARLRPGIAPFYSILPCRPSLQPSWWPH